MGCGGSSPVPCRHTASQGTALRQAYTWLLSRQTERGHEHGAPILCRVPLGTAVTSHHAHANATSSVPATRAATEPRLPGRSCRQDGAEVNIGRSPGSVTPRGPWTRSLSCPASSWHLSREDGPPSTHSRPSSLPSPSLPSEDTGRHQRSVINAASHLSFPVIGHPRDSIRLGRHSC